MESFIHPETQQVFALLGDEDPLGAGPDDRRLSIPGGIPIYPEDLFRHPSMLYMSAGRYNHEVSSMTEVERQVYHNILGGPPSYVFDPSWDDVIFWSSFVCEELSGSLLYVVGQASRRKFCVDTSFLGAIQKSLSLDEWTTSHSKDKSFGEKHPWVVDYLGDALEEPSQVESDPSCALIRLPSLRPLFEKGIWAPSDGPYKALQEASDE